MEILQFEDGKGIAYRLIHGEETKPVLVFLHEGLGCTAMWRDFPDRLCKMTGHPGLSYDRMGFGLSSPVSEKRQIHYLHESALVELPIVLEALIPDREYILIGHADGGSIALLHASEKPERLKAAITEAALVFVEDITVHSVRKTVSDHFHGKLAGLSKYHGQQADAVFNAWSEIWLRRDFKTWNIEYALPSIEKPFFIIQGAQNPYATEAQVDRILAGLSGEKAVLFVEDCGYSPHLEHTELVLTEMTGFIFEQT